MIFVRTSKKYDSLTNMIYAIRIGDDGPIKIGKGRNPENRLTNLQISSPFLLRLLASCNWHDSNETIIHHHLRNSYLRGEWFEPTDEVMKIVGMIKENDFSGACGLIGRLYEMPKFNKKLYQRNYMALRRTEAAIKAGRAERWPRG